ncbi:hypothetical protein A2U01_0088899, partial [Trifolium medium]|nr:hypothetical protein [Trifolium medium]
ASELRSDNQSQDIRFPYNLNDWSQTLGQCGHVGDERKYALLNGGKTAGYFLV